MASKHGMDGTPEYRAWINMRRRCYDTSHISHRRYARRGITVCDEWMRSFDVFFRDMGLRPSPDHSLDRIDNTKGYSASNCRWATARQQAQNRSSNRLLTFMGETLPLTEHCRRQHLPRDVVRYRLRLGWSVDDALTRPRKVQVNSRRDESTFYI